MKPKFLGLSLPIFFLAAGICAQTMLSDSRDKLAEPMPDIPDSCQTVLPQSSPRSTFADNTFSRVMYSLTFSSTSATSPQLDLSDFDTPLLLRKISSRDSYYYTTVTTISQLEPLKISSDGETWLTFNGIVLPKWTRYLSIQGNTRDCQFDIIDLHTDAEWESVAAELEKPKKFLSVDLNRDGKLDGYNDFWASPYIYESSGRGYARYFFRDRDALEKLYFTSNPSVVVENDGSGLNTYAIPGFRHIDHVSSERSIYPMDTDNDGDVDEFFEPETNSVYSIGSDGKFHVGSLPIVTLSQLQADVDDRDDSGRNFVAWDYSMLSPGYVGSQMFGRDGGGSHGGALDGGVFTSMDVNGNGLTDYVNFNNGKVYFNLGNGKYYTDSFNGRMHFTDFNGDGRNDYILYSNNELTLNIALPEGGVEQKKIISGYDCTNVWTRDVDRDGDPDIVLSLESGQNFVVVLENTGNGTFRRRENVVKDLNSSIIDCRDYDNDGYYDIITSDNKAYRLSGYQLATVPVEIAPENIVMFVNPADGMIYYEKSVLDEDDQLLYSEYQKAPVVENTHPVPPDNAPDVVYEPATGLVKISWIPGSDKETPVSDLTYSLRIGTDGDSDDILTAHASETGVRYQVAEGNCGKATSRIIDASGWPAGKYYISVQTVDGNYCGSTFSLPVVMVKNEPSVDFTVDFRPNLGIQSPVRLRLKSIPQPGENLTWNFDGGTEVSRSADGTEITLTFETPGEKNISLSVTSADGVVSRTVSRSLEVFPTSLSKGGVTMDFEPMVQNPDDNNGCFSAAFDMDEDGVAETYSARWRSVFMKGDKDGVYRPIDRMFNNHQYVGKFRDKAVATVDLDGDGMCDIVSPDFENPYSRLYYGYNYGDLDMDFEYVRGGGLDNLYVEKWLDIDNDGAYDVFGRSSLWRNDGTYKNFTTNTIGVETYSTFADCNGDGLVDVIMDNTVYFNNGDFTFYNPTTLPGVPNFHGAVLAAEDFDNNGAVDYLFQSQKPYTLSILWDDFTVSDLGVDATNISKNIIKVHDINNDGFIDILHSDDNFLITILPGRTWEIYHRDELEKDVNEICYSDFGHCFEGSDGITYAISEYYRGYYNTTLPNVLQVNLRNGTPDAPGNIRHTQNERFVVLEWDHSVDAETPPTQMKYNLSVKRKGASGPGAYLFSPANSGKNGVPVPSKKPLIKGNVFSIPVANIPAGEYEVKVQGVDALNKQSDFSPVYNMVVTETASIIMQGTGEVNVPVDIKILVNYTTDVDLDGGRETGYASGVHSVVWDTPGMKTVTVNDFSSNIMIQPAPDGSFTLPVQARCRDRILVPGNLMNHGEWVVIEKDWWGKENRINILESNKYFDLEVLSAGEALIIPKQYGNSEITHFVSSSFSTQRYDGTITCQHDEFIAGVSDRAETPSAPAIDFVTADASTGKYKIQWTNPETIRPEAVGINVYKEGTVAGKYILIDCLPLTATEYVDRTSNPDVMAARYMLTYKLSYGESRDSKAHQPVHVMINRGAGSSWNLIWGKYEGATIPQYRILRGESPESLSVIAEVSGNLTSYTDFGAPLSGALYYAVESVLQPETMRVASRASAQDSHPRSNVIAAAGGNITFAEKITIIADYGVAITESNNPKGLQLRAIINPTGATFGRVNWIVTSGDDVVNVDGSGYVTPVGNGQATVRAQSIDGSGIYDEIVISVSDYNGIESPSVDNSSGTVKVYPSPAISEVTVDGLTAGCDIYIFSVGGKIVYHKSDWDGATNVTLDCSSWSSGIYVVRIQNSRDFTVATRKFIKM